MEGEANQVTVVTETSPIRPSLQKLAHCQCRDAGIFYHHKNGNEHWFYCTRCSCRVFDPYMRYAALYGIETVMWIHGNAKRGFTVEKIAQAHNMSPALVSAILLARPKRLTRQQ